MRDYMERRVTPPKRITSPSWGPPFSCRQSLRLAKKQLCTRITLFCTFPCPHCMTKALKSLISRFVEDMNTRQQLSFSFPELRYSSLEFNSRKIHQPLTNLTTWKKKSEGKADIRRGQTRGLARQAGEFSRADPFLSFSSTARHNN